MFHNPFRDLCGKLRSAVNLSVACSKNGRDSPGKRLGVKNGNGSTVKPNDILVRQRGTKYWPGENVIMGRDHTLHSSCDGIVEFTKCDENSKKIRSYVNVRKIVPLAHGEGSFNLQNIKDMLV